MTEKLILKKIDNTAQITINNPSANTWDLESLSGLQEIIENLNKDNTSSVRLFISGSAPLLEDTFHEFKSRTGKEILERYGMTETNIISSNPIEGKRKPSSVGLCL